MDPGYHPDISRCVFSAAPVAFASVAPALRLWPTVLAHYRACRKALYGEFFFLLSTFFLFISNPLLDGIMYLESFRAPPEQRRIGGLLSSALSQADLKRERIRAICRVSSARERTRLQQARLLKHH